MATDRWGVAIQVAHEEAEQLFSEAVEDFVLLRNDPAATLDAAIIADPSAPLPQLARAQLDLFSQTRESLRSAQQRLKEVAPLLVTAQPREHLIGQATIWCAEGRLDLAARALDRAAALDPHDLWAVRITHDLSFFLGDAKNLRDCVARVASAWNDQDPLFGALQGMYAFGLEETTNFALAETKARFALEVNAHDVWAHHALAHVLEMQGRTREGISFLEGGHDEWDSSFFAVHNWWHLALYFVEEGNIDQALSIYDGPIRRNDSTEWLDLVDACSLLWRLSLLGIDVQDRARALVGLLEPKMEDVLYVFNDLHALMAFSLAGRDDLVSAVLDANENSAEINTSNAFALSAAGLDLLHAFAAFGRGEPITAVDRLFNARDRASVIGGSLAQRDILDQTLIAAATKAGDAGLIRNLTSERLERKPTAAASVSRLIEANR